MTDQPNEHAVSETRGTLIGEVARSIGPRAWVRSAFLAFFVYSCWQLWRYYQWALGSAGPVRRPEATAGFVPLGAIMSISTWVKSGVFDPVLPAAVVIVLAAVAMSLLLKRGFCGWVCPVGTVASAVAWVGRLFSGGRPRRVNRTVDYVLRTPKYLIAGFILFQMAMLPAQVGLQFQQLPYYATSDLKILYGLLHPAWWYLAIFGFAAATTLALASNTWCRYLCPLGALYGALSVLSLGVVKRDEAACVGCGACDRACVARVNVSTSTKAIRSPECDGCQDCTRSCPEPGALSARFGGATVPWQFWPALVVTLWLMLWLVAAATGHWQHGTPDAVLAQFMQQMKLTADF